MTLLDDRHMTEPPYEEGPNKEELEDKIISADKLARALRELLEEEEWLKAS